jgi:hypothetical protein
MSRNGVTKAITPNSPESMEPRISPSLPVDLTNKIDTQKRNTPNASNAIAVISCLILFVPGSGARAFLAEGFAVCFAAGFLPVFFFFVFAFVFAKFVSPEPALPRIPPVQRSAYGFRQSICAGVLSIPKLPRIYYYPGNKDYIKHPFSKGYEYIAFQALPCRQG